MPTVVPSAVAFRNTVPEIVRFVGRPRSTRPVALVVPLSVMDCGRVPVFAQFVGMVYVREYVPALRPVNEKVPTSPTAAEVVVDPVPAPEMLTVTPLFATSPAS